MTRVYTEEQKQARRDSDFYKLVHSLVNNGY